MTTTTSLRHVTSKDGTRIAYERLGDGPPVVLVCGGSVDRQANAGLAAELATDFCVFNYDRRGRGDSSDTLPYAVEREVEDIDAVITAAGGTAHLYGASSGAGLALWEPPYIVDPAARPPADTAEVYERLVAEGRRGDAVEYFMARVVGMPAEFVAFARSQPFWAATEKIAHTLAYDARVMGDYSVPLDLAATVTAPTIILTGGASFPFMRQSAAALAAALQDGRTQDLQGQEHNVDPAVLGPALRAFLQA